MALQTRGGSYLSVLKVEGSDDKFKMELAHVADRCESIFELRMESNTKFSLKTCHGAYLCPVRTNPGFSLSCCSDKYEWPNQPNTIMNKSLSLKLPETYPSEYIKISEDGCTNSTMAFQFAVIKSENLPR